MARSEFEDLKTSLSRALKQTALGGQARALGPVWSESVGALLGRRSRPVRLAQGALTIEADPEFADAIEHGQAGICARLNRRLGPDSVKRLHVLRVRFP